MCLYLGGSSQHVASLYTGMLLLELIPEAVNRYQQQQHQHYYVVSSSSFLDIWVLKEFTESRLTQRCRIESCFLVQHLQL